MENQFKSLINMWKNKAYVNFDNDFWFFFTKPYISIVVYPFVLFLYGSVCELSNPNSVIVYDEGSISVPYYLPYEVKYRELSTGFSYVYKLVDCRGGGVVQIVDDKGTIVSSREYISTDSVSIGILGSLIDTTTIKIHMFYPVRSK